MARVAITIVTYNSASVIDACLTSVMRQQFGDFSVLVIDNCSQDSTVEALEPWRERGVQVLTNDVNLYYSRAHNYGIRETDSEFVLTLNPDVMLRPDFLLKAIQAFDRSPRIGSVNGKLLLLDSVQPDFETVMSLPTDPMLIDSAGLMMFRSRRPFLRGNRMPSGTTCLEQAYIFGADGACAVYRRAMLDATAVEGQYFDNDFVIYREDVDLAWRAQLYGWDAFYVPDALGYHVRGFHPGQDRRSIPNHLKRQSVKNGWLLVVKNDSVRAVRRDIQAIVAYQLKVLAGLFTIERSSLGAIADFIKLLPRMRLKRQQIQGRRIRSDEALRRWFE